MVNICQETLIFIVLIFWTNGQQIVCSDFDECLGQTINCVNNDCNVICGGRYSCRGMTINAQNNSLKLECIEGQSCEPLFINGGNNSVQIICTKTKSCRKLRIDSENGSVSFNCPGYISCESAEINAYGSSTVSLICEGAAACKYAKIFSENGIMTIECNYGISACWDTNITSLGGTLSLQCNSAYGCLGAELLCPSNGECNVLCSGEYASCFQANITGNNGTKLSVIAANGAGAFSDGGNPLFMATIVCPVCNVHILQMTAYNVQINVYKQPDFIPGPLYMDEAFCKINVSGSNSMQQLSIKSQDSWHGPELICATPPCFDDYRNDSDDGPKLFCGPNLDNSCLIEPISNNEWQCIEENHVCDDLSTSNPTLYPTMEPTYNRSEEPPQTLYISASNGCNYDCCQTNDALSISSTYAPTPQFYWTSYAPKIFCSQRNSAECRHITLNKGSKFVTTMGSDPREINSIVYTCCDEKGIGSRDGCQEDKNGIPYSYTYDEAVQKCALFGKTLCTKEQIENGAGIGTGCGPLRNRTWDCRQTWTSTECTGCHTDNTVTIRNYGVHTSSVSSNTYDVVSNEEQRKVACFDTASNVSCHQPKIKEILFEPSDYVGDDKYFTMAYQEWNNRITPNCASNSSNCDVFQECPVNETLNDLIDFEWSAENGPYLFYFTNSQKVSSFCENPKRRIHAQIKVECNQMPSQCQSLEWDCLHKFGECADSEYGANGKIVFDEGEYFLADAISNDYDYIIINGNGKNKTIFHHNSTNEKSLILCTDFCHLTLSNLSYSINKSSMILVQNDGFLRFESVHFENNQALTFVIESNALIQFEDCSFVSSSVNWQISNEANAYFEDCLFDNLSTENGTDSLIAVSDHSNVRISNSEISNIKSKLIWQSLDSFGKILGTSNDCSGVCFEHMNGDLFIDYQSAFNKSVKFGLLNTSKQTNETYTLQAKKFDPETIFDDVIFYNFDDGNRKIIFEPCTLFNSEYVEQTLFDQSSNGFEPTHSFNQSSDFFKEHLVCNQTDICYVKCFHDTLVCPLSTFKSNATKIALFHCGSESSCYQSKIDVSDAESVSILCDDVTSCEEMAITATNIYDLILECVEFESCKDLTVNITETENVLIHCYAQQSCDGLRVHSDKNEIKINIHSFSNDIVINVPSNYLKESLECNPNNAYLRLDGMTFNNLTQAAIDLFDGNMPCEDVKFSFHPLEIDRVPCEIRYKPLSNISVINKRLTHLTDEMECFPAIYISNLTSYDCFGTDAPTQSPTAAPSLAPSFSPSQAPTTRPTKAPTTFCPALSVNVNDDFVGFDHYFDGLFTFEGTENDFPYWSVPQMKNEKNIKPIDYGKWRINGENNVFLDIEDDKFLQHIASITPMTGTYSNDNRNYSVEIKCILTASPTSAPTKSPTLAPTQSPSTSPSLAPSFTPSKAPTSPPTNAPSMDPTADPTIDPTKDPTNEPTVEPSFDPTESPSNAPSFSPSFSPSQAPTAPPSRAPTSLSTYNSFIGINYLIGGMSFKDVTLLTDMNGDYKFNETMNVDIVNLIESAYVNLEWTLHFHEFHAHIEYVKDMKVSDLSNRKRPDIPLTDDCWQTSHGCTLTLKSKLFCSILICEYIFDKFAIHETQFETSMTVSFIDYLYSSVDASNNDKIYFAVDSMERPLLINPPIPGWLEKIENWIIIFVGIVIVIIIFMIFGFRRRIKRMRKKKAMKVTNALVLCVAIGKYEEPQNEEDNEVNGTMCDLDGVQHDVDHMDDLFGSRLNYDVFPKVESGDAPPTFWSEAQLKGFFEERAKYLSNNIGQGKFYDALVCIISCHGLSGYICTSDYKLYSKVAIHRTFSLYSNLREIPRFILYDCCQGAYSIEQAIVPSDELQKAVSFERKLSVASSSPKSTETEKKIEEEDVYNNMPNGQAWIVGQENPDHLLGRVNAANEGFVSRLDTRFGSYVVHSMYEKYVQALDKNQSPFIHEIFDSIQRELQQAGKQMPECVWNDDTRYIVFKKNKGVIDYDDAKLQMVNLTSLASTSQALNDEETALDIMEGDETTKKDDLKDDEATEIILNSSDNEIEIELQGTPL